MALVLLRRLWQRPRLWEPWQGPSWWNKSEWFICPRKDQQMHVTSKWHQNPWQGLDFQQESSADTQAFCTCSEAWFFRDCWEPGSWQHRLGPPLQKLAARSPCPGLPLGLRAHRRAGEKGGGLHLSSQWRADLCGQETRECATPGYSPISKTLSASQLVWSLPSPLVL